MAVKYALPFQTIINWTEVILWWGKATKYSEQIKMTVFEDEKTDL